MKETILTCDRCKKVVKELIEVGAGKREYQYRSYTGGGYYEIYQKRAEWCIPCCIEFHIAEPRREPDVKPKDPPPTLEEMIREIVREEMENK